MRTVAIAPTFEAWQAAARVLLGEGVPPTDVAWAETASAPEAGPGPVSPAVVRVPRQFIDLARQAAGASDPERWQILYAVLWRLVREDHELLKAGHDPQVRRLFAMAAPAPAGPFVPAGADFGGLRAAALRCTGCELYRHATQTVFGRGPADARIVLVGEQPGDQEDLKGAPFVGPAGEVLDRALGEVGLDRERLYVTNAVKHFKFIERGRRRIHQTPRLGEITACRPWLEAELALIRPQTLVCLGATACRALLGPDFRLMKERGRIFATHWAPRTVATLHPSAVLRGEDEAAQARLYRILTDDLRLAGG